MQERKNILLTGATGVMGFEGLNRLLENESFYLTLLVKPQKKNRKKLKKYLNHERIRIVWGDLRSYENVLESMKEIDIVLHVGGMVSPRADKFPEMTMDVNIRGAANIVNAVKAQPHADRMKVVYIGSVAQMGHKDAPDHFVAAGDLMTTSMFDHYAVSKLIAEQIFAESGLKNWVSLRQTSILYPALVKNGMNPITFHVPLKGVLEWATVEDSGRLLAKICEDKMPENFWNRFYNISSGKSYRLTNYEFEMLLLKAIYCPPPEKVFEPQWFALKNFHGCWYSDADVLEDYLHFRGDISAEEYFNNVIRKSVPWYFKLAKIAPAGLIRMAMRKIAHTKGAGTMDWIKTRNEEKIKVYFGSYEEWEKIPSWNDLDRSRPSEQCEKANIGINKPSQNWNIEDMQAFAISRGGKCLSESMTQGDIETSLLWENGEGDTFSASPRYVVLGGFFPDHRLWTEILPYTNLLENKL